MRRGVFMITGLPRSRTAWMANFFTAGKSFCFHEALTLGNLDEVFGGVNKAYVGNSDSGIPFFADKNNEIYSSARHVLIKRKKEEVAKSLQRLFTEDVTPGLNACIEALERYEAEFKPFVVKFEDLHDEKIMRAIWEYCLPSESFDEERWRMLNDFKVEITESKINDIKRRFGLWQR